MGGISLKSPHEISFMRSGGKLLAGIMRELEKKVAPGINTLSLDKLAEKLVFDCGGQPAFKGYGDGDNPFPATICASLNDEVVHGIPLSNRVLKNGDLLKIDIGMKYQDMFIDMARTFCVGKCSTKAINLSAVAEQAFWEGVRALKSGGKLSDYSKAVQKYVEKNGCSVVRNLVGHGVGRELHEDPQIPNYWGRDCREVNIKAGMTLALEPMVNAGTFKTVLGDDGWVFKTVDGSLSAHYENTVLITDSGVEVLTMT